MRSWSVSAVPESQTRQVPTTDLTERIPRWSEGKQQVLNAHRVPARDAQHDLPDIPVRARIEWAVDGVAQVETVAFAACGRLVLVLVSDARCEVRGVWLDGPDVMRR
jgi:hypothetical protein